METLLIELNSPKARKLIDDLVDLGIISVRTQQPTWADLWNRLNERLPQSEPDISENDVLDEIRAYRAEKRVTKSGGIL